MLLTRARVLTTILLLTLNPTLPFHLSPPHKFLKRPVSICYYCICHFLLFQLLFIQLLLYPCPETPLESQRAPSQLGSCSSKPPGPADTCRRTLPVDRYGLTCLLNIYTRFLLFATALPMLS